MRHVGTSAQCWQCEAARRYSPRRSRAAGPAIRRYTRTNTPRPAQIRRNVTSHVTSLSPVHRAGRRDRVFDSLQNTLMGRLNFTIGIHA